MNVPEMPEDMLPPHMDLDDGPMLPPMDNDDLDQGAPPVPPGIDK